MSSKRGRLPKRIAKDKYELRKKIGAGCFGEVFSAVDLQTGEDVAVKLESVHTPSPMLEHGAEILRALNSPTSRQGFTRCMYFGRDGDFDCMVLERLGLTLEDRFVHCNNRFDARTTALIADQALQRIEYLHSKKLLHCDIKPENFLFGRGPRVHILYLIDFGLSRYYWTNKHIAFRPRCSMVGTARYASINSHKGSLQSRRDDLESIGHMLLYFLRGSLPWSGLEAKTKEDKYRKIKEKKEKVTLEELCRGYPEAFCSFLSYSRSLGFMERPDYSYCRALFRGVLEQEGAKSDSDFPWLREQSPYTFPSFNSTPDKDGDPVQIVDTHDSQARPYVLEPLVEYKPCTMPDDYIRRSPRSWWLAAASWITSICWCAK